MARALPLLLLIACTASHPAPTAPADAPPPTRRDGVKDVLHGVTVPDPYRWLEDEKAPEVQAWMKAQDDYARERLRKLPRRDALAKRLGEVLYYDSLGTPMHRGDRYFYTRKLAAKEKGIVYVKENGRERVLLDPNEWTKDGSASLGGYWPTWDGTKVAYKVRPNNADEATIYVLDVASMQRSDEIVGAKYGQPSWTPAGDGFYYTWLPSDPAIKASERPGYQTIRFHKLGEPAAKDAVIVEKLGDPTVFQGAQLSKDGHWLVREVTHGWTSTDLYVRDLRKPGSQFVPLVVGKDAHYSVDAYRDHLYLLTDEGAPNQRMFAIDPAHPAREAWKEIVPERKEARLESSAIVGGKLALAYLKDVTSRLELHELDGRLAREIPLPAIGSASNLSGDEDDDEAYFSFTSFTYPSEIYKTSVSRGGADVYFRLKIPVDPSRYAVEQVFTQSKDGTRVPIFLVHRKDAPRDGSNPTLLTGYGGFLVTMQPTFTPSIYPWLEQGGVYALAILRGGGEYGEEWHRAGMRENKQHVFDDFIAAGEWLVREKWTTPHKLVIRGGSNGGLLVGAATVERPDLFGVALCHVPLLDMVRYHLYGSGRTWISEYGSAEDAKLFPSILAYSPYQHVTDGTPYPATLMLSADSDDRVDPMHARKFAAALQHATTGGPVWLRIERHSGHGGADLVKANIEKLADEYSFALSRVE